jgi:hypothetical protein
LREATGERGWSHDQSIAWFVEAVPRLLLTDDAA